MAEKPIIICTRGSALALAQSNMIAAMCRAAFPRLRFELKIIKTTGDKLQKASMAKKGETVCRKVCSPRNSKWRSSKARPTSPSTA